MNTAQMYSTVLFHLNRTRSARWDRNRHLDVALNTAIEDIMNDRIEPLKRKRPYHFESVTRVKNELSNLVVVKATASTSGNFVIRPADWKYTLGLMVKIDGSYVECDTMDMNEMVVHGRNSLMRGRKNRPKYIESQNIEVLYGGGSSSMTSALISYIKKPIEVSSGPALDSTAILTIGTTYMILSGSITHDGFGYSINQWFTATTNNFSGSGTIALLTNTDINEHLHNEICRRAVVILSGNVDNQDKVLGKTIESEQN